MKILLDTRIFISNCVTWQFLRKLLKLMAKYDMTTRMRTRRHSNDNGKKKLRQDHPHINIDLFNNGLDFNNWSVLPRMGFHVITIINRSGNLSVYYYIWLKKRKEISPCVICSILRSHCQFQLTYVNPQVGSTLN